LSILTDLWPAGKGPAAWREALLRLRQLPRASVGMMLAHLGVAVFIIGVVMVKNYDLERDVRVKPGDITTLGSYQFRFIGVTDVQGPNYAAAQGLVEVSKGGQIVATLRPEKRIYKVQQNPMTEAAIDTGLTRDLYVALGEEMDDGGWTLRVYVKPFIDWIWGGCLLMAIGGGLAASDKRYRRGKAETAAALAPITLTAQAQVQTR
jgi:cytochrome c-type biogenesis protein CcmF